MPPFTNLLANSTIGKQFSANDIKNDQQILTNITLSYILTDIKGER
ncbi:hypothetical protein Krac_11242 [Ktedonobacter racemifer DSM 44963]|uniref:Uncharacterized protein n=1 Tax=Ktedonobacter racemifer DSM 44963 TaxID=485913 RepID=D6TJS0_KTERA|nr:hypothetical protein Krac_11242 [Ktedonobacter racemifer DSM 44963]